MISDSFEGGSGQSSGPTEGTDTNWKIAYFSMVRDLNDQNFKSCGNVVNSFNVDNTAMVVGEDSGGQVSDTSNIATVTITPGIVLDSYDTTGKRLTMRLNNYRETGVEIT